jgi:hypothetical protein
MESPNTGKEQKAKINTLQRIEGGIGKCNAV